MYLSGKLLNSVYGQAMSETAAEITTQELMAVLAVYLVIASVTTPIAVCVIAWIVKNEGRQEAVKAMLPGPHRKKIRPGAAEQMQGISRQEKSGYLLSVPLIVAVVLCLAYMSLELFL